nr:ATP-binding protein [uncultured Cellulosilyticum sp.]
MKSLILVTSPPACGKTFISKELAKALKHVVYLDKDTLIVLSKQIFKVAGEPYNRSSQFFEENIRDYEYMATVDLALEALEYEDKVLINAPFTREIRNPEYMQNLKEKVREKGAKLVIIWVETSPEICKQRMIERASDRDSWKIEHWDEYISGVNFEIPELLGDSQNSDGLLTFKNSSDEEFTTSMEIMLKVLGE